jgi:hypothetical protein
VRLSGQLNIESTGADSKSSAAIGKGTQMIVGGDANITSGNKVVVDKKATLTVTGKLHGQAGSSQQCKINKSASATAQEKSGNCFE